MKSGGGKTKGAQWERDVCVSLSQWISKGKKKDHFWRSAMSGGRATVSLKSGDKLKKQTGDISALSSVGLRLTDRFVVEAKFYKDLNILGMLTQTQTGLRKFWTETQNEALTYNKHPLLIAKQNRMPPLVCLDERGRAELGLWGVPGLNMLAIFPRDGCHVMWLDEFLRMAVPPSKRGKPKLPFKRKRK